MISTSTSPAFGPSRSTSTISSGCLGANATAARVFIVRRSSSVSLNFVCTAYEKPRRSAMAQKAPLRLAVLSAHPEGAWQGDGAALARQTMKALHDPDRLLADGLAEIRTQFQVPAAFPLEVQTAADAAAGRTPTQHADRTAMPFVTLDPASSTDLDQAFMIEAAGADLLLHYAIADVAWFVDDDDAIDREAWQRGETIYLPDSKAGLYPPVLAEGVASLLPDGDRPAVVFTTRVAPDGAVRLEGVERALIRSRAKLAYDGVRDADLPAGFAELARRIEAAEDRRGAARVDPPEQEVDRNGDGHFTLRFRPLLETELNNAALSLATNMAVADALLAAGTGLFRVMPPPDERATARLRLTARA